MQRFFFAVLLALVHSNVIDIQWTGHDYDVTVGGEKWFSSGPTFIWIDGKQYSSDDGTLHASAPTSGSGSDALGSFTSSTIQWTLTAGGAPDLVTSVRSYESTLVFEQYFPDGVAKAGVQGAKNPENEVGTSFPSLRPAQPTATHIGFTDYGGSMIGTPSSSGVWNNSTDHFNGGLSDSGPVFWVNQNRTYTVAYSPFSNFFTASHAFKQPVLSCGILGSVTTIPGDYSMSFILSATEGGINKAANEWGDKVLGFHGKTRDNRARDYTLRYLGYSTDNGAYYYYHTEKGKNYEETLLDVKKYGDSLDIPYKYILLDSWWYYKGPHSGVVNWTAETSVFPHNLTWFYNQTEWRVQGHNRFWSSETTYAKQNGGPWDFVIEEDEHIALPLQQEFWTWLLSASKEWGLTVYEQDWLDVQTPKTKAILQSATLGRQWLMQMGRGAADAGLAIQYCMSWGRHIMQSVEIPQVTQARASGDYSQERSQQWKVGESSLFGYALGIGPSKDNYWSIHNEPGNEWHDKEPYSALQSAVLSFSCGPVTPSDGVGYSNASLIMRACMSDGSLLSPDRPMIAVDDQFYGKIWKNSVTDGQLWTTYSTVSDYMTFHVFAAELNGPIPVTPATFQAPTFPTTGKWMVFSNMDPKPVPFSASQPLTLPKCDRSDFQLWHIAPVLPGNIVLLGESDKWVRVSKYRFLGIEPNPMGGLRFKIHGYNAERVNVDFLVNGEMKKITCIVDESDTVFIEMPDGRCA